MNALAKDLDITVTPMPFVQTLKVVLRAPVTMGYLVMASVSAKVMYITNQSSFSIPHNIT